MNFKQWFKKNFNEEFGSSIQDEALELGWYACLMEVNKIIESHPNLNDKTSLKKAFGKIKKL